ncbi:MAG: tRNA epoxyqueuosine(34) reductase QueG [Planctomycetota bacterium]|nr:MAG: tRNA epoxyqueuosine(34) reductase QueG [Planctomycetota bacterium]
MAEALAFAQLRAWAAEEGLHALAAIPLPEKMDGGGLEQMLADGVGDMQWLARHADIRRQPRHLLPSAHSLIVVALPYQAQAVEDQHQHLRCARYAAGKDYHGILRSALARMGKRITGAQPGTSSRACVDSAPINERSLAQMAGLGWIGRNALLISPRQGSYRFLGVLLTDAEIAFHWENDDADRCGVCTACHQACPTAALVGRRVLSERCISYLTIEHQGIIPKDLAQHFQGWWYGCDRCQEVCPWNRFAPAAGDSRLLGQEDDQRLMALTTPQDFAEYFAGRPQRRAGFTRFRRNLLVALWSRQQYADCAAICAATPLPLVCAQADALGLVGRAAQSPSPGPPIS